jgi:hypothetical protein
MKRFTYSNIYLALCCFLLPFGMKGQGWSRQYQFSIPRTPIDILQYANGDILLADNPCHHTGVIPYHLQGRVARMDQYGDTIWARYMAPESDYYYLSDAALDHSGNCMVVGHTKDTLGIFQITISQLDASGAINWTARHGAGVARTVYPAADGGFLVGGYENGVNDDNFFVLKTDSMGNLLWTTLLPFYSGGAELVLSTRDEVIRVLEAPNQDIYIMGQSDSAGVYHGTFLMKTNPQGVPQWTVKYWEPPYSNAFWMTDMCLTPSGGVAMVGEDSTGTNVFVKTDSSGNIIHTHTEPNYTLGLNILSAISPTQDGGYLIAGGRCIMRTDSMGVSTWTNHPQNTWHIFPQVCEAQDGYAMVYLVYTNWSGSDVGSLLLRLDSLGNLYDNFILGQIYADPNLNCVKDPGEAPRAYWIVTAQPGNHATYTDAQGRYEIDVPSGTYAVESSHPYGYWQANCPASGQWTANFPANDDTVAGLDFALEVMDCPGMVVEINNNFLRRCTNETYYVQYENIGADTATDVMVRVVMDPYLNVIGYSIAPNLPQIGDTFDFDIGTVPPLQSGFFTVTVAVTCDTALFGLTHCVSAHIYPDTGCAPIDPQWDQASIAVQGTCVNNDTVRFTVKNQGTANMSSPGGLVILEDDIMSIVGTFDLPSQQDTVFDIVANGRTYALLAEQRPGHPGYSNPRAFVEGCSTLISGGFSTGHITTQAQDEADHFIAIDCDQNRGSWDPNIKTVSPEGMGPDHLISGKDQLEYTIHFQNCGTDTCFKVVIRDQLDPRLDPLSFDPGPSSHPYTWKINHAGEVEFTFQPIILLDSNTFEPWSHGFVSYTIDQQPGNPVGSVIKNFADIYFDYNPAVRTNTTFDEIGILPWSHLVYTLDGRDGPLQPVKAWPNPFSESATIDLGGTVFQSLQFELYDLDGRMVQRQELHDTGAISVEGGDLHPGLYVFRILADGKKITGKVIVVK